MDQNISSSIARGNEANASRSANETMSQTTSNNPSASPPQVVNKSLMGNDIPLVANTALPSKSPITNPASTSNSTHRLRSSIACTRCRKSKIKCTNSGAGTTCEACSNNSRECLYPAPGTGGNKREGDAEETTDRVKRPRVRKSEPIPDKAKITHVHMNSQCNQPHLGLQSNGSHPAVTPSLLTSINSRTWTEVFDIFQLHYDTDLSFLHGPTFLPRLAEDPTRYAAMTGRGQDSRSLRLLQLGILTLTARHHDGLIRQHSQTLRNKTTQSVSFATSDHFASLLKSLLFNGDALLMVSALERTDLAQIQAVLMLALYEWSIRNGSAAWIYLGFAIRMAQSMEILTEDIGIPASISSPLTGSMSSVLLHSASHFQQDLESSEAFGREETSRRTAWSCVLLDRYFSNGASRPISLDIDKMILQMPCGEKTWIFGDRVCTPFFDGVCSHHRERMKRKVDYSRKHGPNYQDESSSSTMVNRIISSIPCEYGQDEGSISRYVKLVDIWSQIARWSYQGGKTSGLYAPWDERSKYWTLKNQLQSFVDEMPRSFKFTKANSQAHLAQNTSPPFTLLHTVYSICKLVMLREFLPFSPVRITSPSHLDEMETRDSNMHDRRWHSNTLNELFKVAHDFLELIQIYKAISKLPAGPMMGFGLYLVSFIGIYALHFPQMDIEGLVFGKDSESALDFEHQVRIVDALRILAYVRDHLPMAEYWFRTLHRAHKYYKQLNLEQKSNQFAAVNRNTSGKDAKTDPIGSLDTVFQEFGMVEDETISFVMQKEEFNRLSGFTDRVSSPQPVWKPVNANSGASRHIDPLARPAPQVGPQDHAPWYQKRGDHIAQPRISPEYDQPSPYGIPPNTLPPINSTGTLHAYPSTSPPGLSFKPSQSGVILCFSGEDVALFVDARSDKDIAAIQTGWTMIKDDKEPSITGSPNRRSQELRKMQTIGAGWVGVLWQWC